MARWLTTSWNCLFNLFISAKVLRFSSARQRKIKLKSSAAFHLHVSKQNAHWRVVLRVQPVNRLTFCSILSLASARAISTQRAYHALSVRGQWASWAAKLLSYSSSKARFFVACAVCFSSLRCYLWIFDPFLSTSWTSQYLCNLFAPTTMANQPTSPTLPRNKPLSRPCEQFVSLKKALTPDLWGVFFVGTPLRTHRSGIPSKILVDGWFMAAVGNTPRVIGALHYPELHPNTPSQMLHVWSIYLTFGQFWGG